MLVKPNLGQIKFKQKRLDKVEIAKGGKFTEEAHLVEIKTGIRFPNNADRKLISHH